MPYIFKTLWRHRIRTILTVSGTCVAMLVFSIVAGVQQGLNELVNGQRDDRSLIVFQANRFCPSTSKLPADYVRRIREMTGVRDAVPIKVYTNNCRASLDVVVFNGVPADGLRNIRSLRLTAGNWSDFEKFRDGALVGQAVARRRKLSVGQRFTIGTITVAVAGIHASDVPAEESMIYTHLEFLQRAPGLHSIGTATQIEVLLEDSINAQSVCRQIDELYKNGPTATKTRPKGVFQTKTVKDLVDLVGFMRYLGFACVMMVLGLVATTTVMGVQDRIREHAILQTLGFSGWQVFLFIVIESTTIALAGGSLGTTIGFLLLHFSHASLGTEGILIVFQPTLSLLFIGVAISAAVGVVAGAVPGWQASRTEIVTVLRD